MHVTQIFVGADEQLLVFIRMINQTFGGFFHGFDEATQTDIAKGRCIGDQDQCVIRWDALFFRVESLARFVQHFNQYGIFESADGTLGLFVLKLGNASDN